MIKIILTWNITIVSISFKERATKVEISSKSGYEAKQQEFLNSEPAATVAKAETQKLFERVEDTPETTGTMGYVETAGSIASASSASETAGTIASAAGASSSAPSSGGGFCAIG